MLSSLFDRLLAPDPAWFTSPLSERAAGVSITYLGTAGFVVKAEGRTLVLDPYVSRPSLGRVLRGRLTPDEAAIARFVPEADDVLVGHAHFDHVLDAPSVCRNTGARLIGSRAVCMVGRAAGLPEAQLRETRGREDIASGRLVVRGIPSAHGKVLLGRVPFPGDIEAPPPWPPRAAELRHGLVLNWRIETPKLSIVHIDSAEVLTEELTGMRADVVCLCAAGWRARPRYVEDVVELLRPRFVLPCHWDTMVTPLDATPHVIPGLDLPAMVRALARAAVEPVLLPILGSATF